MAARAVLPLLRRSPARSRIEWMQFLSEMAVPIGLATWGAVNWFTVQTATEQFLVGAWPEIAVVSYVVASLAPAALVIGALALAYPQIIAD